MMEEISVLRAMTKRSTRAKRATFTMRVIRTKRSACFFFARIDGGSVVYLGGPAIFLQNSDPPLTSFL